MLNQFNIFNISRYRRLVNLTIHSLKTWGITPTICKIVRKVRIKFGYAPPPVAVSDPLKNPPDKSEIRRQKAWSSLTGSRPQVHLLMEVSAPSRKAIRKTVNSLRAQTYPHWTLLIECRSEIAPAARALLRKLERRDPRIQVRKPNPEPASKEALNGISNPEGDSYISLIHVGDALTIDALYQVMRILEEQPELDVLYTDEVHIDPKKKSLGHLVLKPDWSPEMLLGYNYLGGLCLFLRSVFDQLGGVLSKHQDAREWDLGLRFMEHNCKFKRVPRCCYLRTTDRGATPTGTANVQNASQYREVLSGYLHRQRLSAEAETCQNGVTRIRWRLTQEPRVSIIVPNKDSYDLIRSLLDDLLNTTIYANKEIIIVDNNSTDPRIPPFYRQQAETGKLQVVPFNRTFNYSAACNAGARAASGDLLLFLNNDMKVVHSDWLEDLIGWALQPKAGVVGAKLLYPNGHLQHCGVVAGPGLVSHIWHKASSSDWGTFGTPDSYRNYLAVTGACQMLRRSVFEELGGYDERYQIAFSDIALCLHAWKKGYRIIYTPYAELIHYESYTRGETTPACDVGLIAREIRELNLRDDPFFHPGLCASSYIEPRRRFVGEPPPTEVLRGYIALYDPPVAVEPASLTRLPARKAA